MHPYSVKYYLMNPDGSLKESSNETLGILMTTYFYVIKFSPINNMKQRTFRHPQTTEVIWWFP